MQITTEVFGWHGPKIKNSKKKNQGKYLWVCWRKITNDYQSFQCYTLSSGSTMATLRAFGKTKYSSFSRKNPGKWVSGGMHGWLLSLQWVGSSRPRVPPRPSCGTWLHAFPSDCTGWTRGRGRRGGLGCPSRLEVSSCRRSPNWKKMSENLCDNPAKECW